MGQNTIDDRGEPSPGGVAVDDARTGPTARGPAPVPSLHPVPSVRLPGDLVPPGDLDDLATLDHPRRVLSDGYIGLDRRRTGARALAARATHAQRGRLLHLDVLIVLAVVAVTVGAVLLVTSGRAPTRPASTATALATPASDALLARPTAATAAASTAPPVTTPPTTVPAVPAASAPAAPAQVVAATPDTPDAMGAAALALVRYPWQRLPGYSIVFRPISEAPSPGFYGNTTFTWGVAGGTSTLYVYPGETVERLAAITAFEIGHEVDAGYVEPGGGHDQIAALLGIHPVSWAPECDCAEQGYLSGWYAAAFSDYWSPGVGAWSTLAAPPSGAELTAMEPWLNPPIP
jgi:hypothetical protein